MTLLIIALALYAFITLTLALFAILDYATYTGVPGWEKDRKQAARNFRKAPLWPLAFINSFRQMLKDADDTP